MNQAFFTRIEVDDDEFRPELSEPFRTLLGEELAAAAQSHHVAASGSDGEERDGLAGLTKALRKTNKPASIGAGLKETRLVLLREHLSNQNSPFVKLMRLGEQGPQANATNPALPEVNEVNPRHYRMNRKLSPDEQAELVIQYQSGASLLELSRKFESHRHSVARHLQRAGVTVRPQKKMTPQLVAQAKRLYEEGRSLAEVGRQLGVEASTVGKALKRAGARLRPPAADRWHKSRTTRNSDQSAQ